MKKICLALCAAITTAVSSVSCSGLKQDLESENMAKLSIALKSDAGFSTKALNEEDWRNVANYTVQLLDSKEEVLQSYKGNELPSEAIELPVGTYTVKAFYGIEKPASRNEFRSEGSSSINLDKGGKTEVNVTCSPTCGKVKAVFSSDMDSYFSDYYIAFTSSKVTASNPALWNKGDTAPWYMAVGKDGDEITATISLTPKSEFQLDEAKVVKKYKLERNKAWTLTLAPDYSPETGTLGISISIDDSTVDHNIDIVIPSTWI